MKIADLAKLVELLKSHGIEGTTNDITELDFDYLDMNVSIVDYEISVVDKLDRDDEYFYEDEGYITGVVYRAIQTCEGIRAEWIRYKLEQNGWVFERADGDYTFIMRKNNVYVRVNVRHRTHSFKWVYADGDETHSRVFDTGVDVVKSITMTCRIV